MQEKAKIDAPFSINRSIDTNEAKHSRRNQRILIVNETIETYLETNSDSDSDELLIDESVKDEYFDEEIEEFTDSKPLVDAKREIKASESPPIYLYAKDSDTRFRKIAPKEWPVESIPFKEIWRIGPPKPIKKKEKKRVINNKEKEIEPKVSQMNELEKDSSFAMEIESIGFAGKFVPINFPLDDDSDLIPCPYCNYKNPRINSIKRHLIMQHVGRTDCLICRFRTSSFKVMESHFSKQHSNRYHCPICKRCFKEMGTMKRHFLQTHRNFNFCECFICGLDTQVSSRFMNQAKDLRKHVVEKHFTKKEVLFNCPLCDFSTPLDIEMKSHVYMSHEWAKGSIYQCLECSHLTNNLTSLLEHSDVHKKESSLVCNMCKFKCSHTLQMNLHIKTHDKMPFQCRFCRFKCKYHFLLKYHLKSRHKKGIASITKP